MTIAQQRVLYADVYGIKNKGAGPWAENEFWPVSFSEFEDLLDCIWNSFEDLYEKLDADFRDIVLSDSPFMAFLSQHLHFLVVSEYCEKNNVKLVVESIAGRYCSPDWESLAKSFDRKISLASMIKCQLKRYVKRVKFNSLGKLLGKPTSWSLGSYDRFKDEYIRKGRLNCDYPYIHTLFSNYKNKKEYIGYSRKIELLVDSMLKDISDYCIKHFSIGLDILRVKECWLKRLDSLAGYYHFVSEIKKTPEILLLSEVANPIHKVISLALRRRGVKVVGFFHGNNTKIIYQKWQGYVEYGQCNEFVCPTRRTAKFYESEYRSIRLSRINKVDFVSIDSKRYENLLEEAKKKPVPDAIRKIMLIGFPMNSTRYASATACFSMFHLNLEIKLAELLVKNGYEFIYKMHPDRAKEVTGFFDNLASRIMVEPFEKVWADADAFLFCDTLSSTFGFALCTNRPIFLLDLKNDNWNPEVYELLKKRCVMIPAWVNENNMIEVDYDALLSKLAGANFEIDHSFVEEVMIP